MKTVEKKVSTTKVKIKNQKHILLQMLDDKKSISKHLQEGGSFNDLKKQGYKFATV